VRGIERNHLRELVSDVLVNMGAHSEAAVQLLLGTAAQESHLGRYLRQIQGPALGIMQMEPATHADIVANFLRFRPELGNRVLMAASMTRHDVAALRFNLAYSIAMARVHYMRVPAPLPAANDIAGMAGYWKRHYNTPLGRGTEQEFMENFEHLVGVRG
jgi:hypothetical protein